MTESRPTIVIGPFPDPRHGMAIVTEAVADALEPDVHRIDTSAPSLGGTWRDLLVKLGRVQLGMLQLVRRVSSCRVVVIAADSGEGMYFTALMVLIARTARRPILLQHHTEAYLDQPRRTMRIIQRVGGPGLLNAFLCHDAQARFCRTYALGDQRSVVLGNAYAVPPGEAAKRPDRQVTVGHLGNLSEAKGVVDLVHLARSQPDLPFLVAGPPVDDVAAEATEALGRLQNVRLLGPLDEPRSRAFHRQCDIFLLPSRTEAMPLVAWEALSAGAKVLCYDVGCLSEMGGRGTVRVSRDLDDMTRILKDEAARATTRDPEQWHSTRHRSSSAHLDRATADRDQLVDLIRRLAHD